MPICSGIVTPTLTTWLDDPAESFDTVAVDDAQTVGRALLAPKRWAEEMDPESLPQEPNTVMLIDPVLAKFVAIAELGTATSTVNMFVLVVERIREAVAMAPMVAVRLDGSLAERQVSDIHIVISAAVELPTRTDNDVNPFPLDIPSTVMEEAPVPATLLAFVELATS